MNRHGAASNLMDVARWRANSIYKKISKEYPGKNYPQWLSVLSSLETFRRGGSEVNDGIIFGFGRMRKSSTFRKILEFVGLEPAYYTDTTNLQGNARRLLENAFSKRYALDKLTQALLIYGIYTDDRRHSTLRSLPHPAAATFFHDMPSTVRMAGRFAELVEQQKEASRPPPPRTRPSGRNYFAGITDCDNLKARQRSLLSLHPNKNPSPTATADFQNMMASFEWQKEVLRSMGITC